MWKSETIWKNDHGIGSDLIICCIPVGDSSDKLSFLAIFRGGKNDAPMRDGSTPVR